MSRSNCPTQAVWKRCITDPQNASVKSHIYGISSNLQSPISQYLLVLLGKEGVNGGVEEDAANANGAAEELDGVEGLAEDDGHADDDDDALGGVGDGLGDGTGLLEGHGGELVVAVEPKAGGDEVGGNDGVGLEDLDELTELGSLLGNDEGDRHEGTEDGGEGELVSDAAHAVLEALGLHQLLVFVALEGGEEVGDAGRDEGGDGKVELLDGGEDDSADDDGKAQPLGLGDLLAVEELGDDGGEGWLGGLDDLSEGDGAGTEGEDGGGVSAHEAEGDGEHLDDVVHGDGGGLAGVGGDPKEDGVDAADGQLEGGDGHGETGGTTGGLESELVGDVVVVVADVPKEEVEQEGDVNALEGVEGTAAGLEGVGAASGSGSLEGGLLLVLRCGA